MGKGIAECRNDWKPQVRGVQMKKIHIEEAIKEIETNPHYDARLRFTLKDHRDKTHQQLLEALNTVKESIRYCGYGGSNNRREARDEKLIAKAIEAASFVEVEE